MFGLMCVRLIRNIRWRCFHSVQGSCMFASKVPEHPTWEPVDPSSLPAVPKLDAEMIAHLERLSLVEFNNEEGVERLRSAIEYANHLHVVNTDGIEPMYSVLEDRHLLLDEDKAGESISRSEVLQNATVVEEDYFVAPPGNIPLTKEKRSKKDKKLEMTKSDMAD